MATLYHHIELDNWLKWGVKKNPGLPLGVSFIQGSMISQSIQNPLVFEVDFPTREDVPHFIGDTIPVFSNYLVQTLINVGVDNFQIFPATLKTVENGAEWDGFFAFNVIGLVGAANLEKSDFDTIMEEDDKGSVPLLAFNELLLDKSKVRDLLMFRLAESPDVLLIHDRVLAYIIDHEPPNGWGFDATEINTI